jgi:hypothetical protein
MRSFASLTGDQDTPPLLLVMISAQKLCIVADHFILQAREAAVNSLNMLDRSICEQYLESKTDPLVGTIEPSMYIGEFDWANLPAGSVVEKADVRPYVKEVFANLISVNCEAG